MNPTLPRDESLVARAAIWLPPIVLIALVYYFGVNVPFWDQWDQVPYLQKIESSTLTVSDLFLQHNEHRPTVSRAILLASAWLTGWDSRVELFLSIIVAIASFVVLRRWIARLAPHIATSGRTVLSVLTSFMFFSAAQWENWMWGWQLCWFAVVLCAIGVFMLLSDTSEHRWLRNVAAATVLGAIGTYSLGNGLLLWPMGMAILLLNRSWRSLAVWTASSLAMIALYFHDYVRSAPPVDANNASSLLGAVGYVLAYLGRPLTIKDSSLAITASIVLGAVLLIAFVASSLYVWQRLRTARTVALPWIALGSFAIASAAMTSIGRLGLGVSQAMASRYTTIGILLPIATVVLAWLAVRGSSDQSELDSDTVSGVSGGSSDRRATAPVRRQAILRFALYAFVAVVAVTNALSFARGIVKMQGRQERLLDGRRCMQAVAPGDTSCSQLLYHDAAIVNTHAQYLKSRGWGGFHR